MTYQGRWLKRLYALTNIKEVVDYFLEEASRYLRSCPIVYLKYTPAHHTFVASRKIGLDMSIDNLGIRLPGDKYTLNLHTLREANKLSEFDEFVQEAFSVKDYSILCLEDEDADSVQGLFLFLNLKGIQKDPYVQWCQSLLFTKVTQILMERKLHNLTLYDVRTHLLKRRHFLKTLMEEVHRGKRISHPISLLIVSIDRFHQYVEDMPTKDMDVLLKMLAMIMRKDSRMNDVVGRMTADEFGLILPHTPLKGAMAHAERLRSIIEMATFSKVLPRLGKMTVSIGVSEYPTLCGNIDGLLESADNALAQSRKTPGNKVFIASSPHGLVPDFIVNASNQIQSQI